MFHPQPGWTAFIIKLLVAMAVMGLALWFGIGSEQDWLAAGTVGRVLRLTALVVLGAGAYFVTLWGLGFRLKDFRRRAAE